MSLYIYPATEILNDNPIMVFYQMPPETMSVTLPTASVLPAGDYIWCVVGSTFVGYGYSKERHLTIHAHDACGPVDVRRDCPFPTDSDLIEFLAKLSGDAEPTNDQGDGLALSDEDLLHFLTAVACTRC